MADDKATRVKLQGAFPETLAVRLVHSSSDTEGIDTAVVVIAGAFPLAEAVEVRSHPGLWDKPLVIFAPGKDVPPLDWGSLDVWPVVTQEDPLGQLVAQVKVLARPDPPRPD